MKGFLFFLGSLIRWPVKDSQSFLYFHAYIILVYVFAYFARLLSFDATGLIITVGALGPISFAIYKGLPLDCLDYKAAINRELDSAINR